MTCPECGSDQTTVLRTSGRANEEPIRRRRECLCCGCRFGTVEIVVGQAPGNACRRPDGLAKLSGKVRISE